MCYINLHLTLTECHLPHMITHCRLPSDIGEYFSP